MVRNPKVSGSELYLTVKKRHGLEIASLLEEVRKQQACYLRRGCSVRWEERAGCRQEPFTWGPHGFSYALDNYGH